MNAVLISIRPEWVAKICSGKKTIEVRKTRPKIKTPFKCYIYCTNDRKTMLERSNYDKSIYLNSNIYYPYKMDCSLNGKVIGEYICDEVFEYPYIDDGYSSGGDYHTITQDECIKMCFDYNELITYGNGKTLYGWHISDFKIYENPLELTDFIHQTGGCVNEYKCSGGKYLDIGIDGILEDDCLADFDTDSYSILKHAPHSWCYVMKLKNNIEN